MSPPRATLGGAPLPLAGHTLGEGGKGRGSWAVPPTPSCGWGGSATLLDALNPNSAPKWLKQTFDEADKNGDGSLSISEVLQLLHKLNVNLPRQRVKQMFQVRGRGCRPCGAGLRELPAALQ